MRFKSRSTTHYPTFKIDVRRNQHPGRLVINDESESKYVPNNVQSPDILWKDVPKSLQKWYNAYKGCQRSSLANSEWRLIWSFMTQAAWLGLAPAVCTCRHTKDITSNVCSHKGFFSIHLGNHPLFWRQSSTDFVPANDIRLVDKPAMSACLSHYY